MLVKLKNFLLSLSLFPQDSDAPVEQEINSAETYFESAKAII